MRALFSCIPGYGHFHPLLPLARALVADGHEVAFATAESFAGRVEAAGFPVLPAGIDQTERMARFAPYREELQSLPFDQRRSVAFLRHFATLDAPAKVPAYGLRHSTGSPTSSSTTPPTSRAPSCLPSSGSRPSITASAASSRRRSSSAPPPRARRSGATPDSRRSRTAARSAGSISTSARPASRRRSSRPAPASSRCGRSSTRTRARACRIGSSASRRGQPCTSPLGTVHNDPSVFRVLLAALADVDCNVIVTVGRNNDPAAREPLPANVVVERYIPQALLLPHRRAVVSHGGSGSVLATLAAGLPMLLVPRGADQFENAAHAGWLGTALVLLPDELTEGAARAAMISLLNEESYRESAQRVAAEIAAMPPPEELVPVLVEFAAA